MSAETRPDAPSVATTPERTASLWHDRRFRSFWAGQTISQLGDRISELALPLIAVVALDASAAQVAWLTALAWLPNLLAFGLGAWVDDRRHKRRLMVIADLVRAVLLISLPVAYVLGSVTLVQLYAVALLAGSAGVLFNTAYSPFFAHLVPPASYVDANARLSGSRSASYVVGPALGGLLVQLLTAPVAIAFDALSFVASALLVGRVHVDEPAPLRRDEQLSLATRAREGLVFIWGSPILRAALGCATTLNLFTFLSAGGLTVLFASRQLGLPSAVIGLAFGVGAIGALVGAVIAPRLSRRIGVGHSIVVGAVLFPAPIALAACATGPLWLRAVTLAVSEFGSGLGVMLFDVNLNSLQTATIPDGLRSRVAGAFSTVNYGVRPFGALAGGALATAAGLRCTLLVAAVGGVLSVLWLLPSPIPRVRALS